MWLDWMERRFHSVLLFPLPHSSVPSSYFGCPWRLAWEREVLAALKVV
jgi:hypothetical protein